MPLNRDTIRSADAIVDPLGVLSVYVDLGPHAHDPNRVSAALALGERLHQLSYGAHPLTHAHASALATCLIRIRPQLRAMIDRRGRRGRALFAGLSSSEVWELETAMPVRPTAALEPTGYVRPLVAALDEGRPAGVVISGSGGARLLDWRLGELEQLDPPTCPPGDASSPAGEIAATARAQGWSQILISGEPRIAGALLSLDPPLRGCNVSVTRRLDAVTRGRLHEAVDGELAAARRRSEVALVTHVLGMVRSGSEAVAGLDATAEALAGGRVAHLVYDNERDYVRPLGHEVIEAGMRIDPAERLIELALDRAAEITPVEGRATQPLHATDGVAALTRW